MRIRIRDWNIHFERDRSRQWKHLEWVPIPNKQGAGYRKLMNEKNGLEIYGIWISIVSVASVYGSPRGDLTKYDINDISNLTMIDDIKKIESAIKYLSQTLDWIEVIANIDTNVKQIDVCALESASDSSILFNSIQSNSEEGMQGGKGKKNFEPPNIDEVIKYFTDNGFPEELARRAYEGYAAANWYDSEGKKIRSWKQKAQHVWFKPEAKIKHEGDNLARIEEKLRAEGKI
jgi:hypothetical protein